MQDNTSNMGMLRNFRRLVSRQLSNYPTDLLNIALVIVGAIVLIVGAVNGSHWTILALGLFSCCCGLLGMVAIRSTRLMLQALRISVISATGVYILALFVLAQVPVWWMVIMPIGPLLTAAMVFYMNANRAVFWAIAEVVLAFAAIMVVRGAADADSALLSQVLLAGELILILMNIGVLLLLPEQSDFDARSTAVSKQSIQLGNLAQQISATADGLSHASTAINKVTSQQSSGTEQQASVITEAVTMLNEFISLANQVSDQARSINQLSEQTSEISEHGQMSIRTTNDGMSQVRSQVTVIAMNIAGLADQIQRIEGIIASVSEIATQSNLLALNASIEAARAGVHGRGFAVVADEVRTLAQQSQKAAAQVQNILNEIQEAMKQAVRATQLGDQQVDEGLKLSKEASEVITQLANNINESASGMRNIMAAIDQQSTGLEEITQSMRNMHDVTQQNLESTRTAESVAENLNRLSEELLMAISMHGVNIDPIQISPDHQ